MNKAYLPLGGRPVVEWSLRAFSQVPEVGVIVLVVRPDDEELAARVAGADVEVVFGGRSRQESELRALRHLAPRIERGALGTVLLHDAARPLVSRALIEDVLRAADRHGGAIPGIPADDIAMVNDAGDRLSGARPGAVIRAQTPQGFRAAPLLEVYERAAREGFDGTDTASCVERFSPLEVRWVTGEERNFKITYAHDVTIAERVLASTV